VLEAFDCNALIIQFKPCQQLSVITTLIGA
jgi:hypothetical protein